MLRCERRVKRFRPQCRIEFRESCGRHERERAESADVAVGERAPVMQREGHGNVGSRFGRQHSVVDQERAREARLDDDSVVRVEEDHDGLGAAIAALDARSRHASRQCCGGCVAKYVCPVHPDAGDHGARYGAIEVARDRLSFRELRHRAPAPASRYRGGAASLRARSAPATRALSLSSVFERGRDRPSPRTLVRPQ